MVSNFVVEHTLDSLEECLEDGMLHFIKSLNRLENLIYDASCTHFNGKNVEMSVDCSSSRV